MPANLEEAGWANEFRPIIGIDVGRVGLTLNPIFGYALTGPEAFKPELEPAFKVKASSDRGFALGLEYYAGLGRFDEGLLPLPEQEHLLFAAFDLEPPPGASPQDVFPWELNVGLGKALTQVTGPQWVVKAIVGRSF